MWWTKFVKLYKRLQKVAEFLPTLSVGETSNVFKQVNKDYLYTLFRAQVGIDLRRRGVGLEAYAYSRRPWAAQKAPPRCPRWATCAPRAPPRACVARLPPAVRPSRQSLCRSTRQFSFDLEVCVREVVREWVKWNGFELELESGL